MVAIIKFSSSLRNVLHYNENKLKQNDAKLIHASGYAKDLSKLGFTDKFKRIEKLQQLNTASKKNVTHISLNFDPSEKLNKEQLSKIADTYMEKIGFKDQPYLVYEHYDAGHPHIHIVSTTIQTSGERIKTHNIGRNQSETARKEIEDMFGLVKAEHNKLTQTYQLAAINVQKILYGKSQTKRAITNVLGHILPKYKYTSLAELNAVLRQYNLTADRGSKDSRTFKNNGLVYRVLDEKGNKTGVPIKASDIHNNPGLKFLEEKFKANAVLRVPDKQRVKNAIDLAFAGRSVTSMTALQKALQRESIQLVLRQNDKGIVYGLTYIDNYKKSVFNGSDLGKAYSANAVQERLAVKESQSIQKSIKQKDHEQHTDFNTPHHQKDVLDILAKGEFTPDQLPGGFKQKKKRKKKRLHL